MALQNLKQMRFIGSNYGGAGAGVSKKVQMPDTPAATTAQGSPLITTNSVTVPATSPNWTVPTALYNSGLQYYYMDTTHPGCDCFYVNKNATFWLTLEYSAVGPGGPQTLFYPIPPNGVAFLPRSVIVVNAILGGNPYNSLAPAPIGGASPVTLDQVIEY